MRFAYNLLESLVKAILLCIGSLEVHGLLCRSIDARVGLCFSVDKHGRAKWAIVRFRKVAANASVTMGLPIILCN